MKQEQVMITLGGVSKHYQLGKIGIGYFYREIEQLFRPVSDCFHQKRVAAKQPFPPVLALDNISLIVSKGEIVGIIGRNGSGKSTLLKLLAGVTLPSEGVIERRGRVVSLLDIGVGFQSDLSARENIFLNGAILGMNRSELRKRFDAIVAFSGIERFLDTPIKRFSSGMYIRLAFSIAINCIADVLIIDEILSVADRHFLEQCRAKLKEYAAAGTTILIVSHNLHTIRDLCPRTILLSGGKVVADGETEKVINFYRSG
jgi:lipopolysaccharide transport system ATP-binding protein